MSTKKNLTDDEIYALCIAVESRHQELFGKAKGPNYKQKKIDAWNALKGDLIAQGFKCFEGKSVDDLRDNVYGYRKRNTETKWNNSRKTGGAGVQWKNWEEVIIRAEKFAEDVSIMEDVGDSGEQLTDWQKNVEKEMKKEESEEKPMISTAASSSTSAAAKELIGETPSLTGGGRSNIPIIQMRNKRQKPNETPTPGDLSANKRSMDELKQQLMEKEIELKTKHLQLADYDIQYKRRSVELVELQIQKLQQELAMRVGEELEGGERIMKQNEF